MLPQKRTAGSDAEEHMSDGYKRKISKIESSNSANLPPIDENLQAVYGRETMRRLFGSNVLISGLNGLGAEIAKNLVLAGVKSVTLHDIEEVEMQDLSSNFFLTEEDIGTNRAIACVKRLRELNNAVLVSALTQDLSEDHLIDYQVVVFTDIGLEKAIQLNEYCRIQSPPIAFIKAEVRGVFGGIFCDFGPEFTVNDTNGEEPRTGIIVSIENGNPALVYCVDDEELKFQDDNHVVFSEIKGMEELNDGKPRKIKMVMKYSFVLEEDTTNFGVYEKGGIATEVKLPKVLNFKSLRDSLEEPGTFLLSGFSKDDRPAIVHLALIALDEFRSEVGRFPAVGSQEDAQRLIRIATSINETAPEGTKVVEIDPKLFRHFASGSRAILNPMAAMFGGIVSQEVVKACSSKFHPLFQFFYFDSLESLPVYPLDPADLMPRNSRYDAQISVFGNKLQQRLQEAKIFMVGSGALGCEFLKNFSLMGVSCSNKGKLTVTDGDVIEKNNLSQQFLFRDCNIGQPKSTVAAASAEKINPDLHVEAFRNRASPENENLFNVSFWESLDAVINALDNVNARMYMGKQCVYFQKPLLESTIVGAKCNTQIVIPQLTENYDASRDPPEKKAPICVLHYFPHNIDHCLSWARSMFKELFEKIPNEVNILLLKPSEYAAAMRKAGDAQAIQCLECVTECIGKDLCVKFQDCITWARLKFEEHFVHRVKQLTFEFPEDSYYASTGTTFWSPPKRFPHELQFSISDPSHLNFIMASSILRAETFGIPIPDWAKTTTILADVVKSVEVPVFEPKNGVNTMTGKKNYNESNASVCDAAIIDDLLTKLEECAKKLPPGFQMKPIRFKKDDDTSYHIDMIAGLANMRARNYHIPEVDKLKAKLIACRIRPVIATSTAMGTGLVCLELYKVLAGDHKTEDYRNTIANLALPLFSMTTPVAPMTMKHQSMSWTVWDRWTVKGNLTIEELLGWMKKKGLNADIISCGSSILYSRMFPRHKERLKKKVVDVAKEVAKVELPEYRHNVDVAVACKDDEGNDIDIPLISLYFREPTDRSDF